MIDVIFYESLLLALLLFSTRKLSLRTLAAGGVALTAVCLCACLVTLALRVPRYDFVLHPSPASEAGLTGKGEISAANGTPVRSMAGFLHLALHQPSLTVGAAKNFTRNATLEKPFWGALSSGDVEAASGGLGLLPRNPVYRPRFRPLNDYLLRRKTYWVRIISVQGVETPTLPSFLDEIAKVPEKGVAAVKVMSPSPDSGTFLVLLGPSLLRDFFAFPKARPEETIQRVLEFYGTDTASYRMAILPALRGNLAMDFLAGLAGSFLRPVIQVASLPQFVRGWNYPPLQSYALDSPLEGASLFFKLSSLFACATLAAVFCQLVRKRRSWLLIVTITMLLQVADFFAL